jgi:hypothetical protein
MRWTFRFVIEQQQALLSNIGEHLCGREENQANVVETAKR